MKTHQSILLPFFCLSFGCQENRTSVLAFNSINKIRKNQHHHHSRRHQQQRRQHQLQLHAIPLSKFSNSISFFNDFDDNDSRCCIDSNGYFMFADNKDSSSSKYELYIVEESDIPDLCKFVVSTFGADIISLSQE